MLHRAYWQTYHYEQSHPSSFGFGDDQVAHTAADGSKVLSDGSPAYPNDPKVATAEVTKPLPAPGEGEVAAMPGPLRDIEQQVDENVGGEEDLKKPAATKPKYGQMHDMINLIRQAAAASERTQQAAKYAEMSATAAGYAGQQAMLRGMNILATDGEPTQSPWQPHPYRTFYGFGVFRSDYEQMLRRRKEAIPDKMFKTQPMIGLSRGKYMAEMPLLPAFALPRDILPGNATALRARRSRRAEACTFLHWQAAADVEMLASSCVASQKIEILSDSGIRAARDESIA